VLDELASVADSVADRNLSPHALHGNKMAMAALLLWNMARELPI
jgi:hypothetical protein